MAATATPEENEMTETTINTDSMQIAAADAAETEVDWRDDPGYLPDADEDAAYAAANDWLEG